MKKGDIILIPFPFTGLSAVKNRPALILVVTEFDVTVSFINTQIKWQEEHDITLEPDDLNGLRKSSLIRLSKLTTVSKELIIGKLGSIKESQLRQVNQSLVHLFALD